MVVVVSEKVYVLLVSLFEYSLAVVVVSSLVGLRTPREPIRIYSLSSLALSLALSVVPFFVFRHHSGRQLKRERAPLVLQQHQRLPRRLQRERAVRWRVDGLRAD